MRRLRLLTILAMLLTLPTYGLAGLTHRSCKEEMTVSAASVQAGDCCPGKGVQNTACKQDGTNNPCTACKAGYNCKSPQFYEPTHAVMLVLVSDRSSPSATPISLLQSRSPDGLWRPPRLS